MKKYLVYSFPAEGLSTFGRAGVSWPASGAVAAVRDKEREPTEARVPYELTPTEWEAVQKEPRLSIKPYDGAAPPGPLPTSAAEEDGGFVAAGPPAAGETEEQRLERAAREAEKANALAGRTRGGKGHGG